MNITELRGGKIYPGNSAVGEVLAVGAEVTRFAPGDIALTHCNGEPDPHGFPLRIWAYDQPESVGWYGEEAVVEDWQLVPAPLGCGLNLWEIAALPLRAPTAHHLWRRLETRLDPSRNRNPLSRGARESRAAEPGRSAATGRCLPPIPRQIWQKISSSRFSFPHRNCGRQRL